RLAEHYAARVRWQRQLRSRLALPLALLVLLALLAPLPALIGGSLDGAGYLLRALLPLFALALLLGAWRRFARRHVGRELPLASERLLLALPGLGGLLRLRGRRDLLLNLALLLTAGRPAVDALAEAAETVRNPVLRGAYRLAADDVAGGALVSEALARRGALDARQGVPLVSTGEFAGSLDRLLELHAEQLSARLDLVDGALAEWLPRLLYFGVLGLLAWGVLSLAW
ncbi:MAG TPA: type II secretion system F family protein, partial [Gammaproteobacteria bacterium]